METEWNVMVCDMQEVMYVLMVPSGFKLYKYIKYLNIVIVKTKIVNTPLECQKAESMITSERVFFS